MKGMCGWFGGERDSILAKEITDAMVAAMTDEKSNTMRALYSRCEGIAAWSKIDQASCHEEGSLKVVIVGNVYWGNDELNELAQEETSAAAVAKAYSRSGKAFLEDMHGAFCVAVINAQEGTAIVAIDRLGIYSICYAASCDHFIFATSTDGVVAHPDMERVIDPQSIFNYLFFHSVPSPGSIYKNVRKLLPGQYALFQNGKVETNFYWHLKYADSGQSHFTQRQESLKKLLQTALRRSVTDEQVGAFLSGGTDSSTIAGVLAQSFTKPADTFSIGFAAEGYDEMEFAR
ncbi:MAG: asparagine synthase-related protein, partial [Candidatus Nitrotoga sp.]|nr:asparagine synthase-related protein [Candidatus Nitrotoga sp.]